MTGTIGTRPTMSPEIVELVERPAAVVHIDATMEEFPRVLGEAFGPAARTIAGSGATITGHPFARYLSFGDRIEAEAGFPFAGTLVPTRPDRVMQTMLPGGRAGRRPTSDPMTRSERRGTARSPGWASTSWSVPGPRGRRT